MEAGTWVRHLEPRGVAARQRGATRGAGSAEKARRNRTLLVCCPHSGGWADSFVPWREPVRALNEAGPAAVGLLAVQYPGHGDRGSEEPAADVRAMAAAISAELAGLDPARTVLFGHSFGAMVAYETARRLESAGAPPAVLAVSGARAPGDPAAPRGEAGLPDAQLWRRVTELGGIDPLLADDPELRELVLPALRADITAHERYAAAPAGTVGVDIRCYLGADDPLAPEDAGAGWAARTTGNLVVRVRGGGHFHHVERPRELLADLLDGHLGRPGADQPVALPGPVA
ncbi:thioesterase II family protein [Streptomyces sp. WMMB 322]|uniref:thioesterase II family protein n=1 Tax=Streptomyces sp. WMMB 322 TaxID=1286821 RepID=UPI000823D727|nr:alpha/beta fold hydrolase [Streptomyces sp. WMMB 322]SCK54705.1 Surfactin synthase thioesterase subunit [Streptomyces sp. WMMB 322]